MSTTLSNGRMLRLQYAPLRLDGFEATWAGANPMAPGFCFGSDDGRLLLTDDGGLPLAESKGSISGEAINGVARSDDWLAVSTRAEITVWSVHQQPANRQGVVVFPLGVHDVLTTSSGHFVAPMGLGGILMVRPGSAPTDPVGIVPSGNLELYIYKIAATPRLHGSDLLACACRQGGIGFAEMKWGQESYSMRVATFTGLDVIDVCVIEYGQVLPAVAALGRDGTLILFRDSLDDNPITLKFQTVQGSAYRLLHHREDLFVLTSRGLYALSQLAGRLLAGLSPGSFQTHITSIPMEAVDAAMVSNRWMLIITPDEIRRVDLNVPQESKFDDSSNGDILGQDAIFFAPDWRMERVDHHVDSVVLT